MSDIKIEFTDECIVSNAGLTIVAKFITRPDFKKRIDRASVKGVKRSESEFTDYEIIICYIALLCLGKTQFTDINFLKQGSYYKQILRLNRIPSEEIFRQRLEKMSSSVKNCLKETIIDLLREHAVFTRCMNTDYIPLDIDVSCLDNSDSKKEKVSYTYMDFMGYAPIFAYLGGTGFMLDHEFRAGKEHSNCAGTDKFIFACLEKAQSITDEKLYIRVECFGGSENAVAVIRMKHDQLVLLVHNQTVLLNEPCAESCVECLEHHPLTIKGIYDFALGMDLEEIRFILEAAEMNRRVAEEGLTNDYGLRVGKTLRESINKQLLGNDLANYAMYFSAAAADARMGGCMLPVMSNSGSGNQGLSVMMPVVAVAEKLGSSQEQLARALIMANLIAIHMKYQLGRLAALCGVVIAASGASAAIVYLLGGDFKQSAYSIKNMIGNISGMICDGAKPGCAMKVATAVNAAVQSAILAINDIEISESEGIIEQDIEKTIRNLTRIGSEGMEETDKMILDIMVCKDK